MSYLRFATYLLFLAALYVALNPRTTALPVELSPPPYAFQAEQLLSVDEAARLSGSSLFDISGGLPSGSAWHYSEGPDFDVWSAAFGEGSARVGVGIYAGRHPNVRPPAAGLAPGIVGGVPVLWWQHEDEEYLTRWDAIVPCGREARSGYLHVWLVSFYPEEIRDAAEKLKDLKIAKRSPSQEPNQSPQRNAGSRPFSAGSSASKTPSSLGPRG